ncbi:MAG: C4-dicarboxylate transporter DctA, partial [Brevibacterium sp.]|nr:C4-dicarboxylate transporter DctA [Brevibacterium sp.]MDN5910857.1 C4-dicarboxylate transporter DctA [Brevibacterium sp.]
GIDKFMSECRALTNFTGNAVATLLIGKWTKEIDMDQARAALNGSSPFDEQSLEPDVHSAPAPGAWDESGEPEEKERVTANA